ncbi:BTB/POZ domain-containing protein [Apostasia shenzhenica]|uniref:BTB/POZ domain-containing protein n=1 Tax=Apostasia shenzhenica TaxID=1088818 RepID=A0A2I0AFK1_9ASPA|nr:BTB/POZ domain-containing protein [Apostasia shenzhenica]
MAGEKLVTRGQAWFCTTGLPTDVVIEVDGMSFHLHKFPLTSKSRKLHELLTEKEDKPMAEEEEDHLRCVSLDDFPGGSETFEAAAKFCYGVKIELSAATAAALRCAAAYLEMTEEFAGDNLISRAERFLSHSVFPSPGESVKALKSCEALLPLAEELGIPQRCIDAVVAGACSGEPSSSLFGWPVMDDSAARQRNGGTQSSSWVESLTMLGLPFYKRLISAMRESEHMNSEFIGRTLVSYAKRSIPGFSRSKRIRPSQPPTAAAEQMELMETIITNLQPEKSSGVVTARFLFGLLRTANILRASEPLCSAMEKKVAPQLEQATLEDLLMPSYSDLAETLYDVDAVERILGYYMEEIGREVVAGISPENGEENRGVRSPARGNEPLIRVGRLVDSFMAEVASDPNFRSDKFCRIALALPEHARIYDDGLYRAVDIYLKAHQGMTAEEKEKVAGVMDCRKLTLEACTHAAQNERLPLRAVLQVLFFEQLQLRQAIVGTMTAAVEDEGAAAPEEARKGGKRREAAGENQLLRLGMDSMRNRVQDLERECSSMRRAIERMGRNEEAARERRWRTPAGGWGSLGRRFGCRSRMQVCDSRAAAAKRAVVQQSP